MSDLLDEAICYRRELPIAVHRLPVMPDAERIDALNRRNEALLLMLETLESAPSEPEEGHEVPPELSRIERKLDLVLDLIFELLAARLQRPEAVPVCFNEFALQWPERKALPEGGWVEVDLYLHPLLPRALKVAGQVTDGSRCQIVFEGVSESVRNLLSRFIFRQHRREVARARERSQAD